MAVWMNEFEIERAVTVFRERAPDLLPYAKLLSEWCETVNENSDGWSYWKGGSRPAGRLMDLINAAVLHLDCHKAGELPTAEQMRRTLSPIKAAATRHNMPFPEITVTVPAPRR